MSPQAMLYAVAGLCAACATPPGSQRQLVSDLKPLARAVIGKGYYPEDDINTWAVVKFVRALKRMAREPSPQNR